MSIDTNAEKACVTAIWVWDEGAARQQGNRSLSHVECSKQPYASDSI